MRIALVGPSRFGLGEPYAGGLEAHTATLATQLHTSGHQVTVYAGPVGAPHRLPVEVVPIIDRPPTTDHRSDIANPPWFAQHEDECFAAVSEMVSSPGRFDVIHNNSLHRRLVDDDPTGTPAVHVLHCPPFDVLADAHDRLQDRHDDRTVVAVSERLAGTWGTATTDVVHNGIDLDRWCRLAGPPSGTTRSCAWAGRIIADKAPHLAIDAALSAGHRIVLAGPVQDREYFDDEIRHRLEHRGVHWLGPLDVDSLCRLFNHSDVGIVTPVWDEPFGLVAAEMLACGLPVAAFASGALDEFTDRTVAVFAATGDVEGLADAIGAATAIERSTCRAWAERTLSIGVMTARYVGLYRSAIDAATDRRQMAADRPNPAGRFALPR